MSKILYIIFFSSLLIIGHFIVQKNISLHRAIHSTTRNIEDLRPELESIFNVKAEFFSDEGVLKINIPRNDVKVSISGWALNPFMGLTSWIGFQAGGKQGIEVMAMGDLVLFEDEVNIAISVAIDNDIQITALHNHFLYDIPKVYFMHIEAEGTVQVVVSGINKIFNAIKNKPQQIKTILPTTHAIQGELLEKIITVQGSAKEGMFKFVMGRHITSGCGCSLGKNMGINTWAAFGGTNENAIVDGDFALLEYEVQPVLRALRDAHISITALHNHMINEKPRLLFLHFWGQGKAIDLAQGIKDALDQTSTLKHE